MNLNDKFTILIKVKELYQIINKNIYIVNIKEIDVYNNIREKILNSYKLLIEFNITKETKLINLINSKLINIEILLKDNNFKIKKRNEDLIKHKITEIIKMNYGLVKKHRS